MSRFFRSAPLLRSHLQLENCGRGNTGGGQQQPTPEQQGPHAAYQLCTLYLFNTMKLMALWTRTGAPALQLAWRLKRAQSAACCLCDLLFCLRIASRCEPRRVHVFLVQRAPLWHALEDEMIDVRRFDYLSRQCTTACRTSVVRERQPGTRLWRAPSITH